MEFINLYCIVQHFCNNENDNKNIPYYKNNLYSYSS